ncbi:hypothetical protein GCM10010412_051080 [Nonomuraea recticatena]|uniref:Uncharacterized protein n=1 Tax=Nonomuraea recticatena TaxID=46178 RepID=A0ABN3S9E9_9ACTN
MPAPVMRHLRAWLLRQTWTSIPLNYGEVRIEPADTQQGRPQTPPPRSSRRPVAARRPAARRAFGMAGDQPQCTLSSSRVTQAGTVPATSMHCPGAETYTGPA